MLDVLAGEGLGIGATRVIERIAAACHRLEHTPILFEPCQSVENGGVLFLVPFLYAQGLFDYKNHYTSIGNGYYDIDFTILLLAFMYLCRIKNPEQLKHYKPGELGKIMGSDRVHEAKCLRKKIKEINMQQKAEQWNIALAQKWVNKEETSIYYIDGHVQVYHGHNAKLGKKHVSREKLCLPGMCEFWVNNAEGMPYFVVTGQVNEKMQEMILTEILPRLKDEIAIKINHQALQADPDLPLFTLVFDREASSPKFFKQLWEKHRVAEITYRKNVKDKWDENIFSTYKIEIEGNMVEMDLAEKSVELEGMLMREVRKKCEGGHQTSIISTNKKLSLTLLALYMFSRWSQENFFKYMRQDYDLDRISQYTVEQIDDNVMVVNPKYSNLSYHIKKVREKISRRNASLFTLIDDNIKTQIDKSNLYKQAKIKEELSILKQQEQNLILERNKMSYKIKIKDMPLQTRYNKLHTESKLFLNIIKMICYRAESTLAQILAADYKKKKNEIRALVKTLIKTKIDILPDYKNNTLTVKLYSLATPRDNIAVKNVCQLLNDSETLYPGTNLKLIYKFATD